MMFIFLKICLGALQGTLRYCMFIFNTVIQPRPLILLFKIKKHTASGLRSDFVEAELLNYSQFFYTKQQEGAIEMIQVL